MCKFYGGKFYENKFGSVIYFHYLYIAKQKDSSCETAQVEKHNA